MLPVSVVTSPPSNGHCAPPTLNSAEARRCLPISSTRRAMLTKTSSLIEAVYKKFGKASKCPNLSNRLQQVRADVGGRGRRMTSSKAVPRVMALQSSSGPPRLPLTSMMQSPSSTCRF